MLAISYIALLKWPDRTQYAYYILQNNKNFSNSHRRFGCCVYRFYHWRSVFNKSWL